MADALALEPWWLRWPSWWAEQQRQVERRWGPGTGFSSTAAKHAMTWKGTLSLGADAPRAIDVPVQIDWGPATPFFAPRVTFPNCPSAVHQLNDGSLCLLPPVDPKNGWEGTIDIDFWMGRAEDWLRRYFDEAWAIPAEVWMLTSVMLPGYRYRQVRPETRIVALPASWRDVPSGFGRVRVSLPTGKGIGAVVEWETREGRWERWEAGASLVRGQAEVLEGIWARFAPGTPPMTFRAPSVQRRYDRLLREDWTKAAKSGRDRVTLLSVPIDLGDGPASGWVFQRHAPPGVLPAGNPILQVLAMMGITKDRGPGMPLDPETLNARRRAGRSDAMHEAITRTQVILAGLGSLGSEIAHLLAQEGFQSFYLVDGDLFLPGNEARHRAGLIHAGRPKVDVMADLIREVQPEAQVLTHHGWFDELAPDLRKTDEGRGAILIGATGDEGTEHFLGDVAAWLEVPCVHAWLEADGQVLRAMRSLPGRDPTISAVASRGETPRLPLLQNAAGPRICADTVLPGSALNIHGAANFVARLVVNIVSGHVGAANHWLFTPGGIQQDDMPPELASPYGVVAAAIPGR